MAAGEIYIVSSNQTLRFRNASDQERYYGGVVVGTGGTPGSLYISGNTLRYVTSNGYIYSITGTASGKTYAAGSLFIAGNNLTWANSSGAGYYRTFN